MPDANCPLETVFVFLISKNQFYKNDKKVLPSRVFRRGKISKTSWCGQMAGNGAKCPYPHYFWDPELAENPGERTGVGVSKMISGF